MNTQKTQYRFGFAKQFKKTEWQAMEIVSEPTSTFGQVRKDSDGDLWLWKSSGLRVTAMALAHNKENNDDAKSSRYPLKPTDPDYAILPAQPEQRDTAQRQSWDMPKGYLETLTIEREQYKAQAERLAEALREAQCALRDISNAYQRYFDIMPVSWQTYDHIAINGELKSGEALAAWEGAKS